MNNTALTTEIKKTLRMLAREQMIIESESTGYVPAVYGAKEHAETVARLDAIVLPGFDAQGRSTKKGRR